MNNDCNVVAVILALNKKFIMTHRRAITHADLAPTPPFSPTNLGSKTSLFFMFFMILCGFLCFIVSLMAEASRSQVIWVDLDLGEKGKEENYECAYSGSGIKPLMCAAIAFVGLGATVVAQHLYLLTALAKSPQADLAPWVVDSSSTNSISWQALFFFASTWACFMVAEILLLVGLSVEAGHSKNWSAPKPSCLVVKQGFFSAAAVLVLLTVFLAIGLYLTALRAQRLSL